MLNCHFSQILSRKNQFCLLMFNGNDDSFDRFCHEIGLGGLGSGRCRGSQALGLLICICLLYTSVDNS